MTKAFLLISLFLFSSCTFFESVSKGEKAAQIGNAVLYKSDIYKVLPHGATAEDSLTFVKQYINSWALKQLMQIKAEEQLPKSEKEVSALLEEYRTQLLVFRYESKYIEERLDTVITDAEKEDYYLAHKDHFITKNGIIKARLIRMHNSSPSLKIIKSLAAKTDTESLIALEEQVYNTAYKYDNYGNEWVDLPIVARDMDMDISELRKQLSQTRLVEKKDSSYSQLLQVLEYVKEGEIAPYEYNAGRIDEIILSKRKQELISGLHKDIFNDALDNKKLKIIQNEDH